MDLALDKYFSYEPLGDLYNTESSTNGIRIFRQEISGQSKLGDSSLIHLTINVRACYAQAQLPKKLCKWDGDILDIPQNSSRWGMISSYVQYSKHLDSIELENRVIDFDDKEFDTINRTYVVRVSVESTVDNKKPYLALKPEYLDRSKRTILI